jgi:alkylhydroperoxidase/carboxymuconolactone decarboxylase family protein YurZ
MIMKQWESLKENFEVKDVRKLTGNFLPGLLKKAGELNTGEGLCVVQSFEPIPLYSAMQELGYDYQTEKAGESEYRVYFYRHEQPEGSEAKSDNMPFKPTAIVNFNTIDPKLADNIVNFWDTIWGNPSSAIDLKTRLLLSLANGVGAGRMRQAAREFIKGYSVGITIAEFDELFAMFAWNQGVGYFASEIGPSALFEAYKTAKKLESHGKERGEIVKHLMERFGENNPDISTFYHRSNSDDS